MPIRGVNHITLCVSDLDRALGFYRDVLGARVKAGGPSAAYLELGHLWLCLECADLVQPGSDDSHIALDCTQDDFEALSTRIRAAADIWKENRSEGASIYFRDPDGHKLELHVGTLQDRLDHYATRTDAPLKVRT